MMSLPADIGPTFAIAKTQQPFRLLELPPELLDLLTSADPPKLQFKSPETKNLSTPPEAVLCTPSRTYIIRQQQTSNGVHIIAPTPHSGDNGVPTTGLTSISKCTSSLELMAAPEASAYITLKDSLFLFSEPEDAKKPLREYRDKATVFDATPMSDAECEHAWSDLVAFELTSSADLPKRCFRPCASAMIKAWIQLLETSRSQGLSLAGTLRTSTMLEALLNPDEEWPQELRVAIMRRLTLKHAAMSHQEHAEASLQDGSTLDRATTVQWVGTVILQAQHESQPTSPRLQKSVFIATWKDSLPEEWREGAKIDSLPKDSYAIATDYIRYAAEDSTATSGVITSTSGTKGAAKPATGNKRKWHEKFAAARKQGKPS